MSDGLAILAPVSGKFTSLGAKCVVALGEPLFEFDAAAYEDDRQRLNLIAESLATSAKAAGEDGDLDLSIRERSEIVKQHEASEASLYALLGQHMGVVKAFEGAYGGAPIDPQDAQAIAHQQRAHASKDAIGIVSFQLADARAMLAAARLDLQRSHWAVEDFQRLQPIVERIRRTNDERLRETVARLRVIAPVAGELEHIEASGWIDRGAVMARYKPTVAPRVEPAAQSARGGLLLRHRVREGDRVAIGDAIAELDPSDLQLQSLYLELSLAQQAAQALRLEARHRDASELVLESRLEAARTRKSYQVDQVQRSKWLYESGFVPLEQVREAQAAFDSATLNEATVMSDVSAARRAVRLVREALDLQSKLGDLRSKELTREAEALIVRATRAGTVRWLVAEGSFVSAGTWIAAVSV